VRIVAAAACAVMALLSACAPKVPYIRQPIRMDAFCSNVDKKARPTAIGSGMTSTDDRVLPGNPTFAEVKRITSEGDGAIAYWNEQPLALPRVSVQLGEHDGYARVKAVAVPPFAGGAEYRRIFMELRDHGTYRWFAMNAYDLEDVCVEGKPQA
jgi:hypothetical protein